MRACAAGRETSLPGVSKRRYPRSLGSCFGPGITEAFPCRASYSIFPHWSSSSPTGPLLAGPSGTAIPCWGEKEFELSFNNKKFKWPLLLAAVKFPILGVDFLRHHRLLVDPAANCLVSAASAAVAAVVSTMLPPHQPTACAASARAAIARTSQHRSGQRRSGQRRSSQRRSSQRRSSQRRSSQRQTSQRRSSQRRTG